MTDPTLISPDDSIQVPHDERVHANEDELAAAEECENHWFHTLKVIGIVGKIAIVMVMMMIAICMYRTKYNKWTMVPYLFGVYILVLGGLIALDMTTKYIAGYWIMILVSNYCSFLGFYKILTNMPGRPGEVVQERTKWYFRIMNVLYFLSLVLGFVPRFGPQCTATKVYPPCLNWAAMLFIINFVFHCVIACKKDYFFEEGSIVHEELVPEIADDFVAANNASQVSDGSMRTHSVHNSSVHDSQISQHHWESQEDHLSKKLFRKQMSVYLGFQGFLVICNICIQLWGRVFVHSSGFLGCTAGGW